jgi:penicillin-binding protein 2
MNGSPQLNNHVANWRILAFLLVLVVVFLVFTAKLFSMQILEGQSYVAQAQENSEKDINLPALRGIIYDRNGTVLARNIASYNVVLTYSNLPDDPGAVQQIFRELSNLIGVPINGGELSDANPYVPCVSNHGIAQIADYGKTSKPFEAVKIKCDIDERTAMIVQEKAVDWPGISIEVQPIRDYPTGSITSSLIGFLGPIPALQENAYIAKGLVPNRDKVGYAGLELQYQDLLAGNNGLRRMQVDVGGQLLEPIAPVVAPVPGDNLRLTIDTRLQQAATAIIQRELDDWNKYFNKIVYSSGVVIAINPKTGEVLAMVSYPTYENNRMARFIPEYYYNQLIQDPTNPLLNHAVGDRLPVGSVFKLATAVGALNEGVVTPDQMIQTPPELIVTEKFYANDPGQSRSFVDWNKAGFGQLDFIHGLAYSSNVYFYKLGGGYKDEVPNGGLGICRLGSYARALGYGPVSGIGLPDEQSGLIPDPQWKRVTHAESWSSGDTYISSVGQGYVLATPLQVLLSVATIANDGKLMQPTVIQEVLDGEGNLVQKWLTPDGTVVDQSVEGSHQISPFQVSMKWDMTKDPIIQEYNQTTTVGCEPIPGQTKSVQSWVLEKVREGMRLAVTEGTLGALSKNSPGFDKLNVAAAGKTGTAEYCDKYALAQNRCQYGNWPSHAWTVAFAPYDNPEIAVVAFVYNGTEGSTVSGPIARQVLQSYFELKAMDNANKTP